MISNTKYISKEFSEAFYFVIITLSPVIVSAKLTAVMYFIATSKSASLGHSQNQSIVVQFTKAGY